MLLFIICKGQIFLHEFFTAQCQNTIIHKKNPRQLPEAVDLPHFYFFSPLTVTTFV